MPWADLTRMLLHHPHLPVAILEILLRQAVERGAIAVGAPDRRIADDPSAPVEQSVAQLVVLVANHLLIESEACVQLAPADAHEDGVDLLLLGGISESRAANAKRRTRCQCHRAADHSVGAGTDGTAHHVGTRSGQGCNGCSDVIRRKFDVPTDNPDDVAGGLLDPQIPASCLRDLFVHDDSCVRAIV